MYHRVFKRALDIVLTGTSLVVLAPAMLLVACAILLEDGGPVLFRQRRVGRHGRAFTLLKFRSMPVNTGDLPSAAAGGLTITRVGRVIRRTNLDELPQLFNVLRGEMSLIGPRPALPSQADLTALREANGALACRPGLTGLAQVNSYDGMPEPEKARWDGRYTAELSLAGDLIIILKTFRYLAKRPPVY